MWFLCFHSYAHRTSHGLNLNGTIRQIELMSVHLPPLLQGVFHVPVRQERNRPAHVSNDPVIDRSGFSRTVVLSLGFHP